MANEEQYLPTFQPVSFTGTLTYGTEDSTTVKYVNSSTERSIIRRIIFETAPRNTVSIAIEEDNNPKTVFEAVPVGSLERLGDGRYALDFTKGKESDGLLVEKNQSVIATLLNNWLDCDTLKFRAIIERDKLKYGA